MATKVLVPRLGEGVEEVTITKWLKQEGEPIKELEPLLEVNTDKVDTEIPSPASGTVLQISMPEGQPARVGEILAWIGQPGEALEGEAVGPESPVPQEEPAPSVQPVVIETVATPALDSDRDLGFISPVVARISAEHQVNLQQVKGTGLNGRITKKDVLNFIETRTTAPAVPAPVKTAAPAVKPAAGDQLVPHTTIRRQIAEHMVMSKRTSPHVTTVMEVDLSRVVVHRSDHKDSFARDGANLTFTAYFVAASITALKAYPVVNSSWSDDGLLIHPDINIGMATSLGEDGLIVPVIKNADSLSLLGIARSVNDLANRARARKLQPDEVRGGTFTITNHGITGSLFAAPVINQPQCGILGVGTIQKRAVVVTDTSGNDAIAIRPMVYITLTFDHRILDGASGDWFLMKVKETLENWA